MSTQRKIKTIIQGRQTQDGAGVKLVRVFARRETRDFDPFLMLDAFDSHNPDDYTKGFPWHPHSGIETITYLIAGNIEHGDSLGNRGVIGDGQCQWMTAGSGIIHQEMPQASPHMLGVQLWLNLPATEKMCKPRYHDIAAGDITECAEDGAVIKIIAGEYAGQRGATAGKFIKPLFLDVALQAGREWKVALPESDTVFAYIIEGQAAFGAEQKIIADHNCVLFTTGDELMVKTGEKTVRFLLLAGKPLGEPIAWGGPIVMNTEEELATAFRELDEKTFIKHR